MDHRRRSPIRCKKKQENQVPEFCTIDIKYQCKIQVQTFTRIAWGLMPDKQRVEKPSLED